MADLVGRKLKDYYLLRRLGRGAMAEVYLAQQVSLNRHVALKVLNEELARDPSYVRLFHHEARAAAALIHSSIVQIYEVGETDGIHYIAQEYVPGRNLGEIIHSRGAIQPGLALDILRQVTAALTKAASEGIVHRDIKPENIMLARSGEVKVADFGLARVQGEAAVNMTQVGVTMGTPLYMSPEQINGGELDSRSDIYSLGVTAYHMLTGSPPFSGDSPLAVAVQHLNQAVEPIAKRRPDIPEKFAAIIDRMLAKNPDDRYPDPGALLRELHQLAANGASEGWVARPDDWSLADMIMVADDRAEATARLDDLMKTSIMVRPSRLPGAWRMATIAAAIAVGVVAALWMGRPQLLAGRSPAVASFENAWEQFYHAKKFDQVPAWNAAIEKSIAQNNDLCLKLSRMGLAAHYLRTRNYEAAEAPLSTLANLPEGDSFKTIGIAGLMVVYTNLSRYNDARFEWGRLSDDSTVLARLQSESPEMYKLYQEAEQQLKAAAGIQLPIDAD